ncbi:MAG: lysophospholipid acyltransferase family protein [Pseudomonadota bacterium]
MTRTTARSAAPGLRAARVGFLIALLLLVSAPVQLLVLGLAPSRRYLLPGAVFRLGLKIIGIDCDIRGPVPARGPALILCNHLSWIDIIVLGALMPCHFIAKREVARWPVFGQLARLIGVMFLDRDRRLATAPFRDAMGRSFEQDRILVLFPEGTSTEGSEVLPFKSALLPDAGDGITVHPLTLTLYGNARPHPFYAWYDDTSLLEHMRAVFASGPLRVRLDFGVPLPASGLSGRKALALRAHAVVSENLASAWKEAKETSQTGASGRKP